MSEENIDDIKITVCILRILFYIYFCILSCSYKNVYFIHTVHARKRKFV